MDISNIAELAAAHLMYFYVSTTAEHAVAFSAVDVCYPMWQFENRLSHYVAIIAANSTLQASYGILFIHDTSLLTTVIFFRGNYQEKSI